MRLRRSVPTPTLTPDRVAGALGDIRVRRAVRLAEAGGGDGRLRRLAKAYGTTSAAVLEETAARREHGRAERLRQRLADPAWSAAGVSAAEGFADEADLLRYLAATEEHKR